MPFGWHARGKWHCREKPCRAPQHAQVYRGTLYRASKNQIRRGRKVARSATSQGSVEPCAPESKARTGGFLRENMISDHGLFSFYESQQGAANGQNFRGVFEEFIGLWTTAGRVARQLNQLKASTAMDFGTTIFHSSA